MAESMVARVAEAINRAGMDFINSHQSTGWGDVPDAVFARAAIEAMRTLDRDMIQKMETAVEDSIDSTTDTYGSSDIWDATTIANAVHRAMIDAALTQDTEG